MGIGPNRINCLTIGKVAQGLANWLNATPADKAIAIGFDTRHHSKEFAKVTACVLAGNGLRVMLFRDPQPTPVLDYAVRELGCSAGVVITASHNPREYNGFKVYDACGVQATDVMARAIQAEIEHVDPFEDVRKASFDEVLASGLVSYIDDELLEQYHRAVLAQRFGIDCANLRVVYSPLNGTGREHVERVLAELGVEYALVESQSVPDSDFPACPRPNPENPDAMAAGMDQMASDGADLFLATDPDADRVGVACMDEGSARLLTGNEVGLLLFDHACRCRAQSAKKAVAVTTVVSAPLADVIAEANGVELRRTLTGFKYVGEQIGAIGAEGAEFVLGLEESDGYLRGSYVRDKDGINGLMLVCEVAAFFKARGMTLVDALEELYDKYGFMRDRQLVKQFPESAGMAAMGRLMGALRANPPSCLAYHAVERIVDYLPGSPMPVVGGETDQILPPANVLEWRLEGGSRVFVRPSGTEPKLKCYAFSKASTESAADELLDGICAGISRLIDSQSKKDEDNVIHVILLSGGSGTRLWPLSNSARSKQFLKVLRDDGGNHVSMVQRVFGQIDAVDANIDVTIATSASQTEALAMQVGGRYQLSVEPERRDTAPAIMLATAHLDLVQGATQDDPVVVMPIDTFAEQAYYDCIPVVAEAATSGVADLVLLGVKPTYPSEKYGYIIPASTEGDVWPVDTFKEKPEEMVAASYIACGGLWNCGVFGFRLGWLREITRNYLDVPAFDNYVERYRELPKNSFDYEVVERAENVSVVPYSGTWKDLGTWNTLTEEMADARSGPVWMNEDSVSNVHVINETGLPMVVAGLTDSVVVATADGILVSGKEASAHVKVLVERASYARPMYEKRQWGEYRVLNEQDCPDGSRACTRELMLEPDGQIPYQRHRWRVKVWTVIAGRGEIVIDDEVIQVRTGDSFRIAPMQKHAIRATTRLYLVEVQVEQMPTEDDTENLGFFWKRGVCHAEK